MDDQKYGNVIGHGSVYSFNIFCEKILSARVQWMITNMEMLLATEEVCDHLAYFVM